MPRDHHNMAGPSSQLLTQTMRSRRRLDEEAIERRTVGFGVECP